MKVLEANIAAFKISKQLTRVWSLLGTRRALGRMV